MALILVSLLLLCGYIFLMLIYTLGWYKQPLLTTTKAFSDNLPTLSVIIPARNEEDHIGSCIESILNNHYPAHLREIIVIDDFSIDRTASIAADLLKDNNGRVLNLAHYLPAKERLNSYKKKALEIAITEAKGAWIITTDADCIVPEHWLRQFAVAMKEENVQFIAAPVSFIPVKGKKDILYYFQSLDFMTMQGITTASAKMKLGNMCNGANLAFRKKTFEEVEGYRGIDLIASGDDMLLMYKIQRKYPDGIRYLKSKDAIVATTTQPTWRSFINQRIRWSSKADKYDDKKLTWILVVVYLFNVTFIPLTIAAFFHSFYWKWLLGILFVKTIIELVFLIPVSKFYNKLNELIYFPLLQPLHIFYIIIAGFLGKFGSYQWKGRKVK